jgi:NAD(P)-dependent dehydrogenase (short-subunit alcohol dehydrogenase family)
METVLVVGASGNIGVSVITAALRSQRNVLAIVRNKASADKIFQHVGAKDGITIVEADVTNEDGVQQVVDRVRAGNLPAFQHVYAAGMYVPHYSHLSHLTDDIQSE